VKWSIHLSLISVGRDTVHATTTKICANYETCALRMQHTVQRHKRSVFCAPYRSTVLIYYNNNLKLGWKLIIQRTQFQTWRHIHRSTMKQWTFSHITVTAENEGVSVGIHCYINTTAQDTALRQAALYVHHEHLFLWDLRSSQTCHSVTG
jgi:hypothetical protein